jgi:hypothetical protein
MARSKKTQAAETQNEVPPQVIRLLVEKNPKKPGSAAHDRFNLYRDRMTVEEAKESGVLAIDLKYDARKGFIEFE